MASWGAGEPGQGVSCWGEGGAVSSVGAGSSAGGAGPPGGRWWCHGGIVPCCQV